MLEMKKGDMMKQLKRDRKPVQHAPFIIIFLFLLLTIVGVATNEALRVLEQAARVCLSCIGIG